MNNNKSKKFGNYLLIVILVGILILLIVAYVFLRSNSNNNANKNYDRLSLIDFKTNYLHNRDFTLTNDIEIKPALVSEVYRSSADKFFIDKDIIRIKANQLGLALEEANVFTEVYYWSKTIDKSSNTIKLDENLRSFSISYPLGINDTQVADADVYGFVRDFFGLKIIDGELLEASDPVNGAKTLSFKAKLNGTEIFYGKAEEIFASAVVNNGKIVSANIKLVPSQLTKNLELKPVTLISPNNINNYRYVVEFEKLQIASRDDYTVNLPFGENTRVILKEYKSAFYNYYDSEGSTYILPAIEVRGEYIDDNNNKGNVRIILINQEEDI